MYEYSARYLENSPVSVHKYSVASSGSVSIGAFTIYSELPEINVHSILDCIVEHDYRYGAFHRASLSIGGNMLILLAAALFSWSNGLDQHGHIVGNVTGPSNASYYVIEVYNEDGVAIAGTEYDPYEGIIPGSYCSGVCLVGGNPYRVRCLLYALGALEPIAVHVESNIIVPGNNGTVRVDFDF